MSNATSQTQLKSNDCSSLLRHRFVLALDAVIEIPDTAVFKRLEGTWVTESRWAHNHISTLIIARDLFVTLKTGVTELLTNSQRGISVKNNEYAPF